MKKISLRNVVITIIRAILIISALILFALYAAPLKVRIINTGNAFGFLVSAVIMALGVFWNPIVKKLAEIWQSSFGKGAIIAVTSVIMVFVVLFCATLSSIFSHAQYTATNETTVIALGCRIWGSRPSAALRGRANAAARYLEKNPDAVAILSGGQGPDEDLSEGECMYNIIVEQGISPDRLYIEDKSTSTDENIAFSKKIIEENNLSKNVAIATSGYHEKRAEMICKKNGLSAASLPSGTEFYSKATFFTREVFGIWYQVLSNR